MADGAAPIEIVGLDPSHLPKLREIVAANDPDIPHMMVADVSAWLDSGRPGGEAYFTALDPAGRVLGMTGYRPDPWGVADISWLVWLYVDPAEHRRGIARRLFAHAQDHLRERGCRKVYLDVGNADQHGAAIAFHEQDGFVREGTLRDYWEDGEDFLIFSKRL
ncbi:MAG TPA: GNAT family N-acetyltransferase [Allosphingosinicella sp.]|jgi:ribosomal protein S18 acetylase RimI-like enzyme|nr:GNAT family N-acetyltransferase [Allosphingosinicella sp.]